MTHRSHLMIYLDIWGKQAMGGSVHCLSWKYSNWTFFIVYKNKTTRFTISFASALFLKMSIFYMYKKDWMTLYVMLEIWVFKRRYLVRNKVHAKMMVIFIIFVIVPRVRGLGRWYETSIILWLSDQAPRCVKCWRGGYIIHKSKLWSAQNCALCTTARRI